MKNLFKTIDLVSPHPTLYLNDHTRIRSIFGGLITLILVLFALSMLFVFSIDAIYKTNPKVVYSKTFTQVPEAKNFTFNDLPIMFSMMHPITYAPYVNEKIYTVQYERARMYKGVEQGSHVLNTTICTPEHFKGKEKLVQGIPIEKYYCLDRNTDFELKGVLAAEEWIYYKVRIYACDNKTQECESYENMAKMLEGTSLYIMTQRTIVDPQNYTNPTLQYIYSDYTSVSWKFYTFRNYGVRNIKVNDDDGYLLSNADSKEYSDIFVDKHSIDFRVLGTTQFFEGLFYLVQENDLYVRDYKKIQTVIAETGGFIQVMKIILVYLTQLSINKIIYNKFIERTSFSNENKEKRQSKGDYEQVNNISSSNNNQSNLGKLRKESAVEIIKPIPLNFRTSKETEKISLKNKKKLEIADFIKFYKNKFDPLVFMKIIFELETLKILLFNQEESNNFNHLINDQNYINYLILRETNKQNDDLVDNLPRRSMDGITLLSKMRKLSEIVYHN